MPDNPHITLAELAARLEDGGVDLVEALGPDYFASVHLPGALNLTPQTPDAQVAVVLPDLDRLVVVYGSRGSSQAISVARRLRRLGYRDVRIFAEGKEAWAEAGLPLESSPGPCP